MPADRGDVDTERRHPDGRSLDGMDVEALVRFLAEDQQRAVDAVVGAATPLAALVEATTRSLAAGGRLLYLGAGTSGRLGVLDASECPPTFNADPDRILGVIAGGDTALRRSSEGAEDDPDGTTGDLDRIGVGDGDVVVGIAAGGTTPWVLGGIEKSKDRGAVTALISCARRSSPPGCDHLVVLATGPEPLAGSTRMAAGTATKIALNTLTTAVFTKLGRVRGDRMIDLRATNEKLHDRCLRILLELFPDLDRADADRRLHAAGDSLRAAVEAIETDRAAGA
ncbi:MAG: N-acetylmuramic acid 6-phosphate etherase [Phycisphaeraceae bacterium]|nr:N-acetylmuramic acid 6-phosphate etherase [Phycisphaeraceae bacterium]